MPATSDAVYWDNQQPLDVDQNGWVRSLAPGQIASSLMLRGFSNYPAGQYLVRYKGEGTLAFSFPILQSVPVLSHFAPSDRVA